jgi:hypothetical protein
MGEWQTKKISKYAFVVIEDVNKKSKAKMKNMKISNK